MHKIINSINEDEKYLKNNFHGKFLFVDNISSLKSIPPGIELCVLQTNFAKSDLKLIKKIKSQNPDIEFWICSAPNYLSKENILTANKIGIKTVISSPVDYKMAEEFFNKHKNVNNSGKTLSDYNYSAIANAKVMIVDDNIMNVELLEEILSDFKIKVYSFLKPKEAYQAMMREKFDLFLLDVMMPEMSGFELAKRVKDTPHNQNTPIIFISALSDSGNKIRGYDLGSYAYIEKPFDVNIIKSQIFNVLKNIKTQEMIHTNKENFFATIAHDLKTPINAGINALNLLLNKNVGDLEETQQELVEDLLNSTKFMQDMVENILCKSKMDYNQIELSKQICPLKKLVEHCIDITKYILIPRKQKIRLECEVENTLLPIDYLEMKRAIHNLIANASEYSPDGGKILIKIFETGTNLALSVQDYGRGIALEYQKDVFSQYMTMAKKYKRIGSGLGLYITKRIVEAHEGKILLSSRVGYGTKITVILPTYNRE
ncbi:MAG: hybrid sensor histidine kinase/response regulator [Candidatus Gastranaerophilales bacterium]|nr:hybrid sensor histidine kinase/response regulator [Candidatus Gastranaerophilales bacterium]